MNPTNQPGEALAKEIQHTGMSQKDFAVKIGVTAAYLSMLINGSRAFTGNICRRLAQHTRIAEEGWQALGRAEKEARPKTLRRLENSPGESTGSAVLGERSLREELDAGRLQVSPPGSGRARAFDAADPGTARIQESPPMLAGGFNSGCVLLHPTASVIMTTADGKWQTMRTEQAPLEAGALVQVESLESITLPENLCAQVEGLREMTVEGLWVFPVTLPPGYRGRVLLTIKHLGFVPYELSTLPVARLRFLRVG